MSVEELKRLAQVGLEMWGSNSSTSPHEVFAEDYINHQEPDVTGGISSKNLEAWKEMVDGHRQAFSDCTVKVLMQIAEGNLVASHWEFEAVHTGTYLGHSATGRQVIWTGIQIDRIRDSLIVESWVSWDKSRIFETLGFG
jgi:predicted ester cyclase